MRTLAVGAIAAVLLSTGAASAQTEDRRYDDDRPTYDRAPADSPRGELRTETNVPPKSELYVIPEFGLEFGAINRGVFAGPSATLRNVGYTTGIASITAGVRLKAVNLGVRYQGSYAGKDNLDDMQFHKVYGELGFNWRREIFVASLFFDFGYSYMRSDFASMHGLGGKAGVAFDFYLARWFSLGPVASFDVQGFDTGVPDPAFVRNIWVNTLGATLMGRIGFHI